MIKFQYNKTSLGELGKQLKIRTRALPTLKNKEAGGGPAPGGQEGQEAVGRTAGRALGRAGEVQLPVRTLE